VDSASADLASVLAASAAGASSVLSTSALASSDLASSPSAAFPPPVASSFLYQLNNLYFQGFRKDITSDYFIFLFNYNLKKSILKFNF